MADFIYQLLLTFDATLRIATPLIFCAMAGIFAERSGVIDISLEGKLLSGAFVAAAVAALTGSAWLGLGCAILASVAMSLIHGFACITHKGNQVISGVAINILASGLTVVIGITLFRRGGQTPTLPREARFKPVEWVGVDTLDAVPILGVIYRQLISGHNVLVYLTLLAVPLTAFIIYRTRFGLRLRAVGEVPEAVDSAGVSVTWLRYRALMIGGVLCGIGGAYLSVAQGGNFVRDMSAGKGYIALAAVIFGNWKPLAAFLACLMFGFLEAATSRLQGVDLPLIGEVPTQLMLALPYVLTVLLLAGFIGRPSPPAAIGQPYHK
ncbi:ABC transporter permease [Roseovarius aestuarii]|uniref:L-arabinose transporter permease protein n=1 Tax=Roseovarius aestuarii TaxID=475083 RepID=A0A1X7BLU1_9RHOB|nr:ABC transporter permease [Roseovarius aestuarii]SMC10573.1 L-arabinose transporter permease protein [Roseovarius aestuarii]